MKFLEVGSFKTAQWHELIWMLSQWLWGLKYFLSMKLDWRKWGFLDLELLFYNLHGIVCDMQYVSSNILDDTWHQIKYQYQFRNKTYISLSV